MQIERVGDGDLDGDVLAVFVLVFVHSGIL